MIAPRYYNPVHGVKLDLPKKRKIREEMFRPHEIKELLQLARSVKIGGHHPRAAASRRWAPWICAYSGARIQEVCWLTKDSISCEAGIWVMQFPMTKDGVARKVALHDALIDEGFLEFWKKAPKGDLFIDPIQRKENLSPPRQEQRGSEIGSWIRRRTTLDEELCPNHGWRHTFITYANAAGISKRMANAIAGYNVIKDASDGYYHPLPEEMKRDLDKFPRYKID
jgi:integrase